jgi:glycosyltransferase involved in cell wall biosynthesis
MPAVSVILPTFNRAKYLRLAVGSVFAQSFADWELIIADDGSGDEVREYLRGLTDPRVRVCRLEHSGNPSRVRNAAIRVARGATLAFLDSDDIWDPTKLETQTRRLDARPRSRWSYTGCNRIDEVGRPIIDGVGPPALPEGWIAASLLRLETSIAMPTVMARRDLFGEVGGFDEEQRFGEYHDLCVRMALRSEVIAVGEPLCSVRAHREHYSGDRIAAYRSWARLYGKMVGLVADPTLRAHCRRMRSHATLTVAGLHGERRDHGAVWAELLRASRFSWRYPGWWWGAAKAVARPLVPKALLSVVRQRRA